MCIIDGSYNVSVLPYSVLFTLFYTMANYSLIKALKEGSVMLTTLLLQLSLFAVSVWGLVFWGAEFSALVFAGLILAVISVTMCLYKKDGGKLDINFKWFFFAILAFVGNAGCSIVQRTQVMAFDGNYGKFLIQGFPLSFAVLFILSGTKTVV